MRQRNICILSALIVPWLLAGCDRLDMYDQPRIEPQEASAYFEDGLSGRPPVAGTVPRGGLREDDAFHRGKLSGQFVSAIPESAYQAAFNRQRGASATAYEQTSLVSRRRVLLQRGQERFNIHCAVCHSPDGDGDGIVVKRGFPKPPSYHIERLRHAPVGHLFDVATRGHGAMPPFASRVEVADRWAIAAWIRAIQLSHNATLDDVPAKEREKLLAPNASGGGPP